MLSNWAVQFVKFCQNEKSLRHIKFKILNFYFILECLKSTLRTFWAQFEVFGVKTKHFSKIWQICLIYQSHFGKPKTFRSAGTAGPQSVSLICVNHNNKVQSAEEMFYVQVQFLYQMTCNWYRENAKVVKVLSYFKKLMNSVL